MKKIYTVFALLLVAFGFINPIANNIDVIAAQINSNFDITINSEKEIVDYQFEDNTLEIGVNYDSNMTVNDKQIKIVLPQQMGFYTLPLVDEENIKSSESSEDEEGNTIILVTIPASNNGIDRSFTFDVYVSKQKVSSNDVYKITGEYYELDENGNPDGNTPKTSEASIQIYDYASNGYYYLDKYMTNNEYYVDSKIDMDFFFRGGGSYAGVQANGIRFDIQNFAIDLSKVKYTLPNGTTEYIGDNIEYLNIDYNTDDYDYNEESGVLTLDPTNNYIPSFQILFDSELFVEGTQIVINSEESFNIKMTEVNGNDITSLFELSNISFTLEDSGYDIDLEVNSIIEDNTILPNIESGPLFEVELRNQNNFLQNLSFDVNIPAGAEVTSIARGDYKREYEIRDSEGNIITQSTTGTSAYIGLEFEEPIVGPQTITVEISNLDAGEVIAASRPGASNNTLKFFGKVEGNAGDEINYSVDSDSIYADVYDYKDVLIEENVNFNNVNASSGDTVTIVDKTNVPVDSRSIAIYEDGTENEITQVIPGDSVDVEVYGFTNSYGYTAVTDKYIDPLVYINVPKEILPAGGSFDIGDFTASYDWDEKNIEISEVSVLDTDVTLPNGEDSTLVAIKFEDQSYDFSYRSQIQIKIKFNGIISPEIYESQEITFNQNSFAFGSTNTDNYIDGPGYFSLSTNELDTYGVDLSVGEHMAGYEDELIIDVIVPEAIKSQSLIDANNSGNFYTINENTSLEDFPEYRIGTEGTFKFVQQNTTNEDVNNLNAYFVLPQEENLSFILDSENMVVDSNLNVYYTNEVITDKDGLVNGTLDINWTTTIPEDGIVTAIRLESPSISKLSKQELVIPFNTEYLEVEDSVTYDSKTEGFTSYSLDDGVVTNGNRASMNILKSDTPILTTNVDDSYYSDDDGIIRSGLEDYDVSDDYSVDVDDINKEDTIVTGQYFDGTSNSLTYDEFMNMTQYKAGKYSITYVTDKDADAQETVETNDFNLLMNAQLNVKDFNIKIDQAPKTESEVINNMVVSAIDFDSSSLLDSIKIDNLDGYDVDNPVVGNYDITFSVEGTTQNTVTATAALTVTRDNSTVEPITPEVDGVASISSVDATAGVNNAPTSEEELFDVLEVVATEFDGTDITEDVNYDLGGYDLSDPEMGTYEITFDVTGSNGDNVKSLSTLTVTDESVDIETEGEITGNGEGNTSGENGIENTGISYQITSVIVIFILILTALIVKKKIK